MLDLMLLKPIITATVAMAVIVVAVFVVVAEAAPGAEGIPEGVNHPLFLSFPFNTWFSVAYLRLH